jgi:uncharacterized protein (TIGR02466 family)
MIQTHTYGLFPKPVCFSELDRDFTESELAFFTEQKQKTHSNMGNKTTDNSYILHEPEMADLAKNILQSIDFYVANIMMPVDGCTPYITQSWLNYTEHKEYHHRHRHPNSIISGVLYINADYEKDRIRFFDEEFSSLAVGIKQYNPYNSTSWWLEVKTKNLILFPSHLSHSVEMTESLDTRISLAFNVFIQGALGNKTELTELIIK